MNKTVSFSVRRVLNWLTAVAVIIAGVCFISGCLHIYTVQGAYSRQAVTDVFSRIAVPVYISLALTAIGLVWEFVVPSAQTRPSSPKAYAAMIGRLRSSRAMDEVSEKAITAEQTCRRRLSAIRLAVTFVGAACFLWYALQPSHYSADINASMIRAVWVAIPCFAIPFITVLVTARLIDNSFRREIALLKELPKATADRVTPSVSPKQHTALTVVRIVLFVLAVAALIYGFVTGGTVDVLTKAINICTECIGLG